MWTCLSAQLWWFVRLLYLLPCQYKSKNRCSNYHACHHSLCTTPYICDLSISCVLIHILICPQNMMMRIRRLYCNATIISILVAFMSGWKEVKLALSVQRYLVFSRNHFTWEVIYYLWFYQHGSFKQSENILKKISNVIMWRSLMS